MLDNRTDIVRFTSGNNYSRLTIGFDYYLHLLLSAGWRSAELD